MKTIQKYAGETYSIWSRDVDTYLLGILILEESGFNEDFDKLSEEERE